MTDETPISELTEKLYNNFDYDETPDILGQSKEYTADKAKELARDFYQEQSIRGNVEKAGKGLSLILEKYVEHQLSDHDLDEYSAEQIANRLVPEEEMETIGDIETELSSLRSVLEE